MKGGSEYHLKGPMIPFVSMVEYHPISTRDLPRLHQFGKKVLPGIFLGCVFYAGMLERRHLGRRQRGTGTDGRKTQRKGSVNAYEW